MYPAMCVFAELLFGCLQLCAAYYVCVERQNSCFSDVVLGAWHYIWTSWELSLSKLCHHL